MMDSDLEESDTHPLLRAMRHNYIPRSASITLKTILTGINIANIVLGALYFYDCPGEPRIPYYLIILGAASLLFLFLTCLPCGDGREPVQTSLATLCAQAVMLVCLFAFFIAGNVWIYTLSQQRWNSETDPKRCNRILFLYAFWTTSLYHMCFALFLVTYIILLLILCLLKKALL